LFASACVLGFEILVSYASAVIELLATCIVFTLGYAIAWLSSREGRVIAMTVLSGLRKQETKS
jgi:hypothetical protein